MNDTRADSTGVRPAARYSVYVIELAPGADALGRPAVYVGETALMPGERFSRHRQGGRTASAIVHRYGIRVRSDLATGIGPFQNHGDAEAAESQLAQSLRTRGFAVFGGQGKAFTFRDEGSA